MKQYQEIYLKTKNENYIGKIIVRVSKCSDIEHIDFMKVGHKYKVVSTSENWGWDPGNFITEKEYRKLKVKKILCSK